MATAAEASGARPVRLVNYVAYGSMDVLGAGSMAILAGWVLLFYSRFCGLTPGEAAAIFGIARVIDAFASPIIGNLSDHLGRTRLGQRFGRRRVFILAAIPLLPSFALIWLPGQTFLYYLVSYVLFELVYALVIIPYETLAAEMSPDYATRAKFAGARILFGQSAAILAGFMPLWLINWLGRDSADTFLWMGGIFSGLFMLTAGFLYLFSWERPPEALPPAAFRRASPLDALRRLYRDLRATLQVRAFRLHLGMYLGGYISQDIFNAAFTFVVIFAFAGTTAVASELMGTLYFAQLVAVAIAIPLTTRGSPGRVYRIATALFASGVLLLVGIWLVGSGAISASVWGAVMLAGLGRGALNYVPWATYNYIPDVDEIMTGRRREGSFAGVMTFVRKASQALAVSTVGLIMQWSGFNSKAATQSPEAVHALLWLFAVGTLAVLCGGWLVSLRFRLNRTTHGILMAEIDHLRAGGAEPTSIHAQAVVEDLTGRDYHELWDKGDSTHISNQESALIGEAGVAGRKVVEQGART